MRIGRDGQKAGRKLAESWQRLEQQLAKAGTLAFIKRHKVCLKLYRNFTIGGRLGQSPDRFIRLGRGFNESSAVQNRAVQDKIVGRQFVPAIFRRNAGAVWLDACRGTEALSRSSRTELAASRRRATGSYLAILQTAAAPSRSILDKLGQNSGEDLLSWRGKIRRIGKLAGAFGQPTPGSTYV